MSEYQSPASAPTPGVRRPRRQTKIIREYQVRGDTVELHDPSRGGRERNELAATLAPAMIGLEGQPESGSPSFGVGQSVIRQAVENPTFDHVTKLKKALTVSLYGLASSFSNELHLREPRKMTPAELTIGMGVAVQRGLELEKGSFGLDAPEWGELSAALGHVATPQEPVGSITGGVVEQVTGQTS